MSGLNSTRIITALGLLVGLAGSPAQASESHLDPTTLDPTTLDPTTTTNLTSAKASILPNCDQCRTVVDQVIAPTLMLQSAMVTIPDLSNYAFGLELCVGNTYVFSLCGGATFDTYLCLHEPACAALAGADDDFCGVQSQITFSPTIGGQYILQLEAFNQGLGGPVTLNYQITAGAGCGMLCTTTPECDDGEFCNGAEICNTGGRCQPAPPLDCDDADRCTVDSCDEVLDRCDNILTDTVAPSLTCTVTPRRAPTRPVMTVGGSVGQETSAPVVLAPLTTTPSNVTTMVAPGGGQTERSASRSRGGSSNLTSQAPKAGAAVPGPRLDGRLPELLSRTDEALSCGTPCTTGTLTQTSNPYYGVAMACGNGDFTANTGPMHPDGGGLDVIFGGDTLTPGTSDITFYVHETGTSYLSPTGGRACAFDPPDTATEPNNFGIEAEWTISPTAGMNLVFREEMVAFGNAGPNSGVRLSMCVENLSSSTRSATVGVRWQVDHQNSIDDGPLFATVGCQPFGTSPEECEERLLPATDVLDFYRIRNNTGTPIFSNFVSTSPLQGFPGTRTPDRLAFAYWPNVNASAWTYMPASTSSCSPDRDSAVLYYYGYDPLEAMMVAPGQSECRSVIMFTSAEAQNCQVFEPGSNDDDIICVGEEATIEATAVDDCTTPVVTLTGTSPGAPACIGNPCIVTFPAPGIFDYFWHAEDSFGNFSECTSTVEVIPSPIPRAGADVTVCIDDPVTLDGTPSSDIGCPNGLLYEWRDGMTVVATTPTFDPPTTTAGTTVYTLAVRCEGTPGCEATDDVIVEVVPPPVPEAGADVVACIGDVVVLDGTGSTDLGCPSGLEYEWRDGMTVVATTPTWNPPTTTAGTTVYTLSVSCTGLPTCEAIDTVSVEIVAPPVPVAGPDVMACVNDVVILDGTGSSDLGCPSGLEYEWRDGVTVVATTPTWNPPTATPGSTTYTLTVRCMGLTSCTADDTVEVVIDPCTLAVRWDVYGARGQAAPATGVEVYWRTLEEDGTILFQVERAPAAAGPYAAIGMVVAQGPGFDYSLLDATPGPGDWYRIVEYTIGGRGDETPSFQAASQLGPGARSR